MSYTLGIDIGTTGCKGVLANGSGDVVAHARRSHAMLVPRPGWAEHRPDADWWGGFAEVSRELVARRASIRVRSRRWR